MHLTRARLATGLLVPAAALVLAGCASRDDATGTRFAASPAPEPVSAAPDRAFPGGIVHYGNAITSMAEQYNGRVGPYSATGASAWVRPAPPPAYVTAQPLPAADPPAPAPAAVANRQPASPPAADAANVVRPEAAQPETPAPAAASRNPAVRTQGLALFNSYSCGACHGLADAGAAGSIGPSLDRNPRLTKAYTVEVITDGRGAMPAFGGQLTPEEIDVLAEYIVQFARN